jgi:SAM-dependent MidA family methyltransferase
VDARTGLRRQPPPDLDAVKSDPILVERIRSEVARDGAIPFARFMEIALYDPERGYYRSEAARPGRRGDFLTAPEAHPIFGRALARHLDDVRQLLGAETFTIREHGAGDGLLAEAILGAMDGGDIRYRAVEINPRRIEGLRARLEEAGLADRFVADDGSPIVGAVVANEVLDALPTHRVVQRDGRLREMLVGWVDGRFVDVEADPSTPLLAARLAAEGIALSDGQHGEICLAADAWVATAAAGLERGLFLLIDYGYPATELYDPVRRPRGTLAAYLRHRAHDDPYRAVGRQDLTAHVDVTAIDRAAARAGLDHLATTTQGRFLAGLGAGDLLVALQTAPGVTLGTYLEARSALVRMVDPAAMGRFRVMAFGRGLPAGHVLRGLA